MKTGDDLERWQDYLEAALPQGDGPPLLVRVYRETQSTQDVAKTFAPQRALVITDHQSDGRGRLGRPWLSAPGASILMSLCWPTDHFGRTHDQISLLAGVALAKAVEQVAPQVQVRLKWPNDVLVDQKKLAGILIERAKDTFVIGIGLNATYEACPDEALRPVTTSLEELGYAVGRLKVIETIYVEINKALDSINLSRTLDAWRTYASLGQRHTFEHKSLEITGEVLDLDPDHGLIVRRDTGEIITLPAATTSVVK